MKQIKLFTAPCAVSLALSLGLHGFASGQHMEGSPQMREHMAVFDLVKESAVTHTAVQDGDWSDASTWGGSLPNSEARVLIPAGITVTVDSINTTLLRTIRVDGILKFATDADTELHVDTLVVHAEGALIMGTAEDPVQDSVTARLVIDNIDDFEISNASSPDFDPQKLGLGVVAHGTWIAHGMEREPSATFRSALQGETTIKLDRLPENWQSGDEIVIANCRPDAEGDEVRTISSLDRANAVITLDSPLAVDHITPRHTRDGLELRMHIINLTRNIIVETAPGKEDVLVGAEYINRGHTMMMHSNKAELRYVLFREMGRTNKLVGRDEILMAEYDESGQLLSTAYNPIARYPVHFHRAGTAEELAVVEGCAVVGSPGWAYVNHSSAAKINSNVSYDIDGASFVSEAGNEIGEFIDNVSIRTHGVGQHNNGGGDLFKIFGNAGDGYWIHSQFVRLERNVASGFTGHGLAHWQTDEDLVDFSSESLPSQFAQDPELETEELAGLYHASTRMKNNSYYGGWTGVFATFSQSGGPANYMEDLVVFGVQKGVRQKYFHNMVIYNSVFIGNIDEPMGDAFSTHNKGSGWKFFDCHFEGFERGVSNTGRGNIDALVGGYLNNVNNIYSRKFHPNSYQRLVKDVTFARALTPRALAGRTQSDFKGIAAMGHAGRDYMDAVVNNMFYMQNGNFYKGYLAYEQTPQATPFINGTGNMPMPESEMSKTNAELEPYNYALEYVPADAFEIPSISYDNWIHEQVDSLPSAFDGLGVYVVEPVANQLIFTDQSQTVIDLANVFFNPLGETRSDDMTYTVSITGDTGFVSAELSDSTLTLTYNGADSGDAIVKVTASSNSRKASVSDAFRVTRSASFAAAAPQAIADSYSVDQDGSLSRSARNGVLSNDRLFENSAVTVSLLESTNSGELNLSANGSFSYIPNPAYSGRDWFTYKLIGEQGSSNIVKVSIVVNDTVNDAPVAVDDQPYYYEAIETLQLSINEPTDGLLINDYDPDGNAIAVADFDQISTQGGSVSVSSDGTFTYTPQGDYTGPDSFTYTVTDGQLTSQSATAHIYVKKVFSAQRPFFTEDWSSASLDTNNWVSGSEFSYSFVDSNASQEADFSHQALQIVRGNKGESRETLSVAVDASNFTEISVEYERYLANIFENKDHYLKSYWSADGGNSWNELEKVNETVTTLSAGEPLADDQLYAITADGVGIDYSGIGGPDAVSAIVGSVFSPSSGAVVPAGGNLNESPTPDDEDGNIAWTRVKFDLPAEAEQNANLMLRFYVKSGQSPPKVQLDNIKVLGVPIENSEPLATNDSYSLAEDTVLSVLDPYSGLLANDYDAEGDYRVVQVLTQPVHGQLTMNSNGTFIYQPDSQYNGPDSFTYRSSDLRLNSPLATVNITITPVEDAPVAVDDIASVVQGESVSIEVLSNDEDDDGDSLSIVSVGAVSSGSAVIDSENQQIIYTSETRQQGNIAFTYVISDPQGNTAEAQVVVEIEAAADAPVAESTSSSTLDNGGPVSISLQASSPMGHSLIYSIVDQPAVGSVSIAGNVASYTPVPGYVGSDSFTFRVDDGTYFSNLATVDITLLDGNLPPTAVNDNGLYVVEGVETPLSVVANDTDPNGDALQVVSFVDGAKGTLSLDGGVLSYTANDGESGVDTITYTVSDGKLSDTASATLVITPAEDDVVVHYSFDVDTSDLSGNDHDGSIVGDSASLSADGRFGEGSFQSDGLGHISLDELAFTTGEDWSIAMWIKSNESDTSKSYRLASKSSKVNYNFSYNGALGDDRNYYLRTGHSSDNKTWTSTTAPVELDTGVWHHVAISCKGSSNELKFYEDGVEYGGWHSGDDTAMIINSLAKFNGLVDEVWITKSAITSEQVDNLINYNLLTAPEANTAPEAADMVSSVDEGGSLDVTLQASDAEGASLSYSIVSQPANGAVTLDGRTATYTPAAGFVGEDSFTFSANDGLLDSNLATVTVTVNEVNVAPVASSQSVSVDEDSSVDIILSASDENGDVLSYTISQQPANGTVSLSGNVATYQPDPNSEEDDSFTFTANDGEFESNLGLVSVTVNAVPEPPNLGRVVVNNVSSTGWTTVDFGSASYVSPVVIATPIYVDSNTPPVVTRIRNVNDSGFEVKLDRFDGLTDSIQLEVSIVVVEEGIYTLDDHGVTMEAVKFDSSITADKTNWISESRSYLNDYSSPVVLGQVMSSNDVKPSVFWSHGSVRNSPADGSSLALGKHVGADADPSRANETIGYIVIEAGSGSIEGVNYHAALGADSVRNFTNNSNNGYSYDISAGGFDSVAAVALSQSGMDGSDGSWPALFGANALSNDSIDLIVDEDQLTDSERKHTTEQVGYLIFE